MIQAGRTADPPAPLRVIPPAAPLRATATSQPIPPFTRDVRYAMALITAIAASVALRGLKPGTQH